MKQAIIALFGFLLFGIADEVFGHPGSGIVVDRRGNVYFVDTGSGVWKIDRKGKLTRLSGPAYHWMAMDIDGRLANVTLPYFSSGGATVTRVGGDPTLLLSSDFPVTVGSDGSLYYPWLSSGKQLQIFRLSPAGTTTILKTLPANTESGPLRWLNGMASGPDGSLYYTENKAIRRITPKGEITTFIDNIMLTGCDSVPEVGAHLGPYFRGLDVDAGGSVYVAATGCRAVLKISADKKVTTVLRASSPWSPTGVAVYGSDVYVLEYFHTPGDNRREWLPRIRKVASDGSVVTVAAIER
ncbi:MAG: hypothetical protein HYZ01_06225 [Ignavibacteriales bacterium]|nr:hypothetical protein [Ignavibacteriales bacterium]